MVGTYTAKHSSDDRLAPPSEVRHELGLDDAQDVLICVENGLLRIVPIRRTLDETQSSATPRRLFSDDFDVEIEEAMDKALRDKYR